MIHSTFLALQVPSDALKYGFIGFGFLLALLSYYSFHQAMRRTVTRPRLIMFFAFLGFSLVLSVLGLFAEHLKASHSAELQQTKNDLVVARKRIGDALKQKEGAIDTLRNKADLTDQQRTLVEQLANTLETADKVLVEIQRGN